MDMAARALHDSLIIIDGHCDTASYAAGFDSAGRDCAPYDLCVANRSCHIDFPRLLEGGVTAQFFAMFTDDAFVADARGRTYRMLEAMEQAFDRCGRARLATKASHVLAAKASHVLAAKAEGTLAAFLTIEGGEAIGESLDDLRSFYARGVRLMTLTWNRINAIGRGADQPGPDGLTPFGRRVIAEMERLGMIVDVSHLCDQALDEVLAVAQRPLVASHSNARALVPHRRNLTDDQAERIAATGGLVAVTFAGLFVDPVPAAVTVDRVLDHVDHLVSVIGAEHVGLGTDFDGFPAAIGMVMPDCTHLPELTEGLVRRGYPEQDIRAIMGGNWLRIADSIFS